MKILHVIDTLGRGGAEQLLVTLLPELARQGHEMAVAVRSAPFDLQPELEAAGIPVIRLAKRYKWHLTASSRDIAQAMPDADIVHAHLYFPAISTALLRIWGLGRAKTCVTFHNLAYAGANKDSLGLRFQKFLAKRLYNRGMDAMFAVSEAVAHHYGAALSLDHVEVLYNPINLDQINAVNVPNRRDGDPLHIMVPGRLVHEKGHHDLLAALRDPRFEGHAISITFAGYGKLQPLLETMAADLPFPLEITGKLSHQAILERMATADIVVAPSHYEGFGLTALEAMSLRKPVIASSAGGLPEVLGDTGRLVAIGDVKAISDAILELAQDPELRQSMGKAARIRSETQFSLQSIANQLINHYRMLTEESDTPNTSRTTLKAS